MSIKMEGAQNNALCACFMVLLLVLAKVLVILTGLIFAVVFGFGLFLVVIAFFFLTSILTIINMFCTLLQYPFPFFSTIIGVNN